MKLSREDESELNQWYGYDDEDDDEEINYESELELFAESYDEEKVKEAIEKMKKAIMSFKK